MADEGIVDEIISTFFLNTCRLCPPPGKHVQQAAVVCGALASAQPGDDENGRLIPVVTGSVADFYIEPILSDIDDIDILFHKSTELALPQGHRPPTQLPAEFHNYVRVFKIIDSHLPAYVYLKLRYLLTKCTDSGRYNAVEYEYQPFLGMFHDRFEHHEPAFLRHGEYMQFYDSFAYRGPALTCSVNDMHLLPVDLVQCVRCLSWPSQAADWPSRRRNYSWPESSTVDRVVSDGCDLVQTAHRQCRQDEVMSKQQWRLSFSRAEVTLINSWMPLQQIVYVMLRFFMKSQRLVGPDMLWSYHIKTLMLWACEMKPKSWWTDDLSLIRICVKLLHTLAIWLNTERCPHYFVNHCNLFDNLFTLELEMTASKLLSIDEDWLLSWFVNNYIRRSAELCPESISWLFDDVIMPTSVAMRLQLGVSAVVDWRLKAVTSGTHHVSHICVSTA